MPWVGFCFELSGRANGCRRVGLEECSPRVHLEDDEGGVDGAELTHVSVHAGHDVGDGLADRDQHSQKLLSPIPA